MFQTFIAQVYGQPSYTSIYGLKCMELGYIKKFLIDCNTYHINIIKIRNEIL